ncbi:MAG: CBS domain-containing protein [Myxococcales bacterium]|nr:CBS domain-containing protein [Myxococcales bacterium]MCB9714228.1 CBS domain-containing protein [Myxococcales bacterium]
MSSSDRPIRDFMTPSVHTIPMESTLPQARAMMKEHGIRHLPVLDGTSLVGLLSDRDLARMEGFPMIDFDLVSVPDAMSEEPYVVAPDDAAIDVFRTMQERRYGSAIISDGGTVVGVFTTTDALRVLVELMR